MAENGHGRKEGGSAAAKTIRIDVLRYRPERTPEPELERFEVP